MNENTPLAAFVGATHTKEQAVKKAQDFYEAGQFKPFISPTNRYGTPEFEGDSVGCMANGYPVKYINLFGLSEMLAYISGAVFNGLEGETRNFFTVEVFRSIPVGADTNVLSRLFMHWLLVSPKFGAIQYTDPAITNGVAEQYMAAARYQPVPDMERINLQFKAKAQLDEAKNLHTQARNRLQAAIKSVFEVEMDYVAGLEKTASVKTYEVASSRAAHIAKVYVERDLENSNRMRLDAHEKFRLATAKLYASITVYRASCALFRADFPSLTLAIRAADTAGFAPYTEQRNALLTLLASAPKLKPIPSSC